MRRSLARQVDWQRFREFWLARDLPRRSRRVSRLGIRNTPSLCRYLVRWQRPAAARTGHARYLERRKICQPALIASLIARSAMSVGHDRRRDGASRQKRFPNGLHGAIPHGVGGISSMSTRTSASAVESANLSSEAAANKPAGLRRRSRRGRGESAVTSSTGHGLAGTGAVRAAEPVAR